MADSKNNNRGLVGVVSFVPSKQTDASRYLDLDFDTLKIYSSHTSYGVYNYSKNRLLKNPNLDFPVVPDASYRVSLIKDGEVILVEVLK